MRQSFQKVHKSKWVSLSKLLINDEAQQSTAPVYHRSKSPQRVEPYLLSPEEVFSSSL
jgi:hypothetical protein